MSGLQAEDPEIGKIEGSCDLSADIHGVMDSNSSVGKALTGMIDVSCNAGAWWCRGKREMFVGNVSGDYYVLYICP